MDYTLDIDLCDHRYPIVRPDVAFANIYKAVEERLGAAEADRLLLDFVRKNEAAN